MSRTPTGQYPHDAVPAAAHPQQAQPRPHKVDALVATVQREFPHAHIRITGRGRTVQRQAELMLTTAPLRRARQL